MTILKHLGFTRNDLIIVVQVTKWSSSQIVHQNPPSDPPFLTEFGGIPMSGGAYVFDFDHLQAFMACIASYTDNNPSSQDYGKIGDAVYNVYTVPKSFINTSLDDPEATEPFWYEGQLFPNVVDYDISKPTHIDGYSPINKKLLTYPYCYLVLSNNNGASNILPYEKFETSDCEFKIKGVPTVGGSIKCVPNFYGDSEVTDFMEEEGIVCGKFPILSWTQDEYRNWLLQNVTNMYVQGLTSFGLGVASVATMTAGLFSGNPVLAIGGIAGTISSIGALASLGAQDYEHSLTPNSAKGNTNCGDLNSASGNNGFYFYKYSIKEEFARRIDKYFSMYGYKTNLVKTPNILGRQNWNFVKTVDCNIEGTKIPEKDINILKQMFDNGITLWHNFNTFRDYSQSNNIVS